MSRLQSLDRSKRACLKDFFGLKFATDSYLSIRFAFNSLMKLLTVDWPAFSLLLLLLLVRSLLARVLMKRARK